MYQSFETLRPKLEEVWARFGIPNKIVHNGGPPYNSYDWKEYAKEKGCDLELYTPEHPQLNGTAEKIMDSLAKITHAAIAEGTEPSSGPRSGSPPPPRRAGSELLLAVVVTPGWLKVAGLN